MAPMVYKGLNIPYARLRKEWKGQQNNYNLCKQSKILVL